MANNEWLTIILRAVYRRHKKPEDAQVEIERAFGVKLAAAFEEGHKEAMVRADADAGRTDFTSPRRGENFGGDLG